MVYKKRDFMKRAQEIMQLNKINQNHAVRLESRAREFACVARLNPIQDEIKAKASLRNYLM